MPKNIITALASVAVAAALGCGGSDNPTVKVNSATSTGEVKMSGSVGVSGGKLAITLAAISDPDDPTKVADPANVTLAVTSSATSGLSLDTATIQQAAGALPTGCTIGAASASSAKADILFVNDTTGSMSGTTTGILDSVDSFASAIAGSVDARFSMYTYGDAFATKYPVRPSATATGNFTEFTIGKADFTMAGDFATADPIRTLDDVERPYCSMGTKDDLKAFLNELKASSALGSGGGDGPENTIGAIAYAHSKVVWREGASRTIIAIGDNPSHQTGDGDVDNAATWPTQFKPTTGSDLVAQLTGKATVHVVGNDRTYGGYYNLKGLTGATGTGGVFLDLPSDGNVNLNIPEIKNLFTKSFSGFCADAPKGTYDIIITADVVGSKGTRRTGTLKMNITVG